MGISQITRRDIIDVISLESVGWSGRLDEIDFLQRIFDLSSLPSTDSRFSDAAGDIFQHRVRNPYDWDDDYVFYDPRFNILSGDDETFLNFLCETVHPVVRPDQNEVERLVEIYNNYLKADGFALIEKARISGRPVFVGRYVGTIGTPGVSSARHAVSGTDWTYVSQQITRMEAAVANDDPGLAIGTAKELVETCCWTILNERGAKLEIKHPDINQLVKATAKELRLTPADISDAKAAADTIRKLLNNLGTITQGIAELRNKYGTGHGPDARRRGLGQRHAKLAVGAASTLVVFLTETHREK